MSHDIRTPMNAIVGMTAIASAHVENTEQVKDCLKKIALSSRHLLGLINDVLDMSQNRKRQIVAERGYCFFAGCDGRARSALCSPQIKARNQQFDIHIRHIQSEQVLYRQCAAQPGALKLAFQRYEILPRKAAVSP